MIENRLDKRGFSVQLENGDDTSNPISWIGLQKIE